MKIKVNVDEFQVKCKHMSQSYYNHNYYLMPYKINDCDVAYFEFCEQTCEEQLILGIVFCDKFIPKYYIEPIRQECDAVDLSTISDEQRWT